MEPTIYAYREELQNLGYNKNTINNYPKYIQNLLNYTQETPQNMTPKHIKAYYEYLQTKPKKNQTQVISKSHICSQLLAIKKYFEFLEKNQIIKRSPYQLRIKQPINKERTVLTVEQIQILYKSCETIAEKTILNLCYGCGLRRSEAENLQVKDINFESKLLFIRNGKGKKRRVVPLTTQISQELQIYYQSTLWNRKRSPSFGGVGEDFLIDLASKSLTGAKIYEIFKTLLKRTQSIDYKKYCLHSLRHSIATHLLENEMSIEMIRDFLGHTQLATTQVYTRINLLKNLND